MKLVCSEQAWEDYCFWQHHKAKLLCQINDLIKECTRTSFSGTGKPDALRGALSSWWPAGSTLSIGWYIG